MRRAWPTILLGAIWAVTYNVGIPHPFAAAGVFAWLAIRTASIGRLHMLWDKQWNQEWADTTHELLVYVELATAMSVLRGVARAHQEDVG